MREDVRDIDPSVSAAAVHAGSQLQDFSQACWMPMLVRRKLSDNNRKLLEVLALGCVKWVSLKEGNYFLQQVFARSYHEHPSSIARVIACVGLQVAASQRIPNHFQHRFVAFVLRNVQFGNHLPAQLRTGITLDGYMEATFAINKPCDIVAKTLIWPSLLIACT